MAFASHTLTATERNYAAVQKFHQYLYGRSFTLVTNHKPLTIILAIREVTITSCCLTAVMGFDLSAYTNTTEFRPTKQHANADGLSRLPLGTRKDVALQTFIIGQIQAMPVTTEQIQATTRQDPLLSQIFCYVGQGRWMIITSTFTNAKMNYPLKLVACCGETA